MRKLSKQKSIETADDVSLMFTFRFYYFSWQSDTWKTDLLPI